MCKYFISQTCSWKVKREWTKMVENNDIAISFPMLQIEKRLIYRLYLLQKL